MCSVLVCTVVVKGMYALTLFSCKTMSIRRKMEGEGAMPLCKWEKLHFFFFASSLLTNSISIFLLL